MHPAIRILSCVIFIILITNASWSQLAISSIVLVILHVIVRNDALISSYIMVKRLRWLLFSILVVTLWFTPGEAILKDYEFWSPSIEGMVYGAKRMAILVEIVMAVNILLLTTSTELLIAALHWLLSPMKYIGVQTDKLALRIVITIDAVKNPAVDMKKLVEDSKEIKIMQRISHVVSQAYSMSRSVENDRTNETISIEDIGRPEAQQWIWLPVLIVAYYLPVVVY